MKMIKADWESIFGVKDFKMFRESTKSLEDELDAINE